ILLGDEIADRAHLLDRVERLFDADQLAQLVDAFEPVAEILDRFVRRLVDRRARRAVFGFGHEAPPRVTGCYCEMNRLFTLLENTPGFKRSHRLGNSELK